MADTQAVSFDNTFAPWQGAAAFNMYWQYNFVNRAAYYANIRSEYRDYMQRWVQNPLWWYDGWVPYFHNADQGIFSTKLGTALVNNTSKKVIGGRLAFKNAKKEKLQKDENGDYIVNPALAFVSTDWSERAAFHQEVKKAITFAAAGGTSLLKLDKHGDLIKVTALRFDSFFPTVGFDGKILDVCCFVRSFTSLYKENKDQCFDSYYVVEHRYFADYVFKDGTVKKNAPVVSYEIRRTRGTITTSQDYDANSEGISFKDMPKKVKGQIAKAFDGIRFDCPILLPFADSLGVYLVNWTSNVSALPELPFGESMLSKMIPYLQSYDYYFSAFNTDMYLGRGRVVLPKPMQSKQAAAQNSGWKDMIFSSYPGSSYDENKPLPIQFDLRSTSWKEIRDMLIQNMAMAEGLNVASVASFLQDNTAAKTAREISTEESETALYVEDKREILEKPINALLKQVTTYYGYTDTVVLRWSSAGLTNAYTRTEMTNMGLQGGFISRQRAVQMNNPDMDEYQLQEEYEQIQADDKNRQAAMFGGTDAFDGMYQ